MWVLISLQSSDISLSVISHQSALMVISHQSSVISHQSLQLKTKKTQSARYFFSFSCCGRPAQSWGGVYTAGSISTLWQNPQNGLLARIGEREMADWKPL
jgi:hypothetical protein